MPNTETATIRLNGVVLKKAEQVIVGPISVSLTEARIGLIGRNGSGKTTLAHLIAGLEQPSHGSIHIGPTDVWKDRKAMCGLVGVLFQNPDHQIIFPLVHEELAFGLHQRGLAKAETEERVQAMLQSYGRLDWHDRAVATLSHGQKQLVCLMAILLMQPVILLLDEPFASLDLPTQLHLQRIFSTLPQRIVHITHNPQVLTQYQRILWMQDGQVQRDGPAHTVLPAYQEAMHAIGAQDAYADNPI